MHPDLVLISNLWSCDSSIDRLKAEYEALVAANTSTAAALAELDKKLGENAQLLEALKQKSAPTIGSWKKISSVFRPPSG